jgi:hypothetical protein
MRLSLSYRKSTVLFLLFSCFYLAASSQEILKSTLEESYKDGAWTPSWLWNYEYDRNTNLVTRIESNNLQGHQSWDYCFNLAYNSNHQSSSIVYQQWENGIYENAWRWQVEYQSDEQVKRIFYEEWNGIQWLIQFKADFVYDTDRLMSETLSIWDNNQWFERLRYSYSYNNGTEVYYEGWDGIQWVIDQRETYAYNMDGKVISCREEDWRNGQWEERAFITYEYDQHGNEVKESRFRDESNQASSYVSYDYDLSERQSDFIHPFAVIAFMNPHFLVFDSDIMDLPDHVSKFLGSTHWRYDQDTESYQPTSRMVHNYEEFVNNGESQESKLELSLYPNPANKKIAVSGLPNSQNPYIISDITGKVMQRGLIYQNQEIELGSLSKGSYFLTVEGVGSIRFIRN